MIQYVSQSPPKGHNTKYKYTYKQIHKYTYTSKYKSVKSGKGWEQISTLKKHKYKQIYKYKYNHKNNQIQIGPKRALEKYTYK